MNLACRLTLARCSKPDCSFGRGLRQLQKTRILNPSRNQFRTFRCLSVLELLVDRLQLLAADAFAADAELELLKR